MRIAMPRVPGVCRIECDYPVTDRQSRRHGVMLMPGWGPQGEGRATGFLCFGSFVALASSVVFGPTLLVR